MTLYAHIVRSHWKNAFPNAICQWLRTLCDAGGYPARPNPKLPACLF